MKFSIVVLITISYFMCLAFFTGCATTSPAEKRERAIRDMAAVIANKQLSDWVRMDALSRLLLGGQTLSDEEATIVVPSLIETLKDDNEAYRSMAASALGMLRHRATPAVPTLINLLKDPETIVRHNAASSLGDIGDQRALAPLREALAKEQDPDTKKTMESSIAILEGRK